jgi:DNA-directed RNA polymerase-3 subunit RPC5
MAVRLKQEVEDDYFPQDVDMDVFHDEVVQEIDVFLYPELASQMYLLQYPLQQDPTNHHDSLPKQARIKPKHGLLEMTHDLPRTMFAMDSSPHWGMKDRTFTSHTVPLQTHMCLGQLRDNRLQLFPLNHIAQMRPSLDHINTEMEAMDTKESDDDTKKPVVFQRRESERAAMARRSSYAYKKASEDAEEWNELSVKPASSIRGVDPTSSTCVLPTSNHKEYLESLNYMPAVEPSNEAPTQNGLIKQMSELLHKGLPVPFSILRMHIPDSDEFDILEALSFCAVQVQGNYLLNSQHLVQWRKEHQRARTLILLLLQQRGIIERPRLQKALRIPAPTTNDILQLVAKKTTTGWVLKIDRDSRHLTEYAKNRDLHLQYWQRQAERFRKELKLYDSPIKIDE